MKINCVDNREFPKLAYHEVLEAIVMETPSLRELSAHPRQFFQEALRRIKTNSGKHMALCSLIVWVKWNEMLDAVLHTAGLDESIKKRAQRSKACSPAGVVVDDHRYRRCEMYACPMCWYRHVRDRAASLAPVFETQDVGKLVRLRGRPTQVTHPGFSNCSKRAISGCFELAQAVRERLKTTGALTTVRLFGGTGMWLPTFDMLMTGTEVKNPEDAARDLEGIPVQDLTVWHVEKRTRGVKLTNCVAEILHYPTGVFSEDMRMDDLRELFNGDRLVRSSVSGILQSRLRESEDHMQL